MPKTKQKTGLLKGHIFDFEENALDDPHYEICEAVVTSERIALDWVEDGETFHVLATSRDGGSIYRGRYGCPKPQPGWEMEIARYTAKNNAELLVAKWTQSEDGNSGLMIIRLSRGN